MYNIYIYIYMYNIYIYICIIYIYIYIHNSNYYMNIWILQLNLVNLFTLFTFCRSELTVFWGPFLRKTGSAATNVNIKKKILVLSHSHNGASKKIFVQGDSKNLPSTYQFYLLQAHSYYKLLYYFMQNSKIVGYLQN